MWISKKKYENEIRKIKNEVTFQQLNDEAEMRQWEDIRKLKKDVKKLKKIIREGY